MNQTTNPHFLYLHSSIATQLQVYDYIQRCIGLFEEYFNEKFNREVIVNVVTKYDGTPLNHSYVWCKSVEVVNLLLNRTKDGIDRTEDYPDPEHDTTEAEEELVQFFMQSTPLDCSWVDLVEEEEMLVSKTMKRLIKRQMKPLVDFGVIEMTLEQKTKYPDMKDIHVKFMPLRVPVRAGYCYHKLFANHISKDVTDNQIKKYFEPFCSEKKNVHDKRNYPIINIDRKSNPTSVMVTYQPASMDGVFAVLMNKKVVLSEKCTLNFDLYREK